MKPLSTRCLALKPPAIKKYSNLLTGSWATLYTDLLTHSQKRVYTTSSKSWFFGMLSGPALWYSLSHIPWPQIPPIETSVFVCDVARTVDILQGLIIVGRPFGCILMKILEFSSYCRLIATVVDSRQTYIQYKISGLHNVLTSRWYGLHYHINALLRSVCQVVFMLDISVI